MLRAALFDLDGTLLYTLRDIADSMNRTLVRHGLPAWPVDDYRMMVGNGAAVLARRAVGDRTDLTEAVLADYKAEYSCHSLDTVRPYEGVPGLLAALREKGLTLAVFSNKPDADTRAVIAHFFPGVFAHVQGQKEGMPLKPDPAVPLSIAAACGVPPAEWAYFGDSATDMNCAVRAGMLPVGVLWGYRGREELVSGGAQILLEQPRDGLNAIGL